METGDIYELNSKKFPDRIVITRIDDKYVYFNILTGGIHRSVQEHSMELRFLKEDYIKIK